MSGIRWTEEDYEAWKAKSNNRPAVSVADVEPHNQAKSERSNQADEVYQRFHIHVHHRTRRLADATGRSHKAAVDGIVRGGILVDDKPKYLEGISESYEEAEVEETIITVELVS